MLKQLRQQIINNLWDRYHQSSTQMCLIEDGLQKKTESKPILDHLAIIDLPGPHTSIDILCQFFSAIGFLVQGRDYLADKQNDFLWLTENDSLHAKVDKVLPQIVVADFRLEEMPPEVRSIILKYSKQAPPSLLPTVQNLAGLAYLNNSSAAAKLADIFSHYFKGRDWPLPSVNEFRTVHEFNELLAWVLVFGRQPNHFGLSVHLLPTFNSLEQFNRFIENELHLPLNHDSGTIKGNKASFIEQSSTKGMPEVVQLSDGEVRLPGGFVEFVWRYPIKPDSIQLECWNDYFTGFVARHADHVIESLYTGN